MNMKSILGASAFALCTLFASSAMADAVVVDTQIDHDTKGSWMGVYGSCYNVLPQGSGRECLPEIEIGPDFVGSLPNEQYDNDKCDPEFEDAVCIGGAATDQFDVRIFSNAPPTPGDGDSLDKHAFVWGFEDANVEAGTAQQNACLSPNYPEGPIVNYPSTFDSDLYDYDPLSGELKVLMGGDATIAYYFLDDKSVCRAQHYELFIGPEGSLVSVASGEVLDINQGKYVVFTIEDIPDNALVRLDVTKADEGDCENGATGVAVNSHMSGIFVDGTRACAVPDGDGCTPGFWKKVPKRLPAWVGYSPGDKFKDHFENAFGNMTLLEVLKQGGGGLKALGRHTVAALLNGANWEINYGKTDAEVIAAFNAVYPGTKPEYTALKNEFADDNERGCPINGKTAPVPN